MAQRTHNLSWTYEYKLWLSIRRRCRLKTETLYPYYGGRGITFDPRWENFINFYEDIGPRPKPTYSLKRIDLTKGYYKDNVVWAKARLK